MTENKAPYSVEREGDLIVVHRLGKQSADSVIAIRKRIEELTIAAGGTPMDILVIVTAKSPPDEPSIKESIRNIREMNYKRIAIVTMLPERMRSARAIQAAGQAGERVRLFRTEEDAREWLGGR